MLVATGVDPHTKDLDRMTPADLAEECKHLNCANYLRSQRSPDPPTDQVLSQANAILYISHVRVCVCVYLQEDELEKPKTDLFGLNDGYLVKSPVSPKKNISLPHAK